MSEIIEDATSGPRAQGNPSGGAGLGETPCSKPTMKEMSDTPETDEAAFVAKQWERPKWGDEIYHDVVTIEFAEKLERERDEARREAEMARDVIDQIRVSSDRTILPWEKS